MEIGHQHSKLFLREPLGVASRKILNMSKKRLRLLVGTVLEVPVGL